MNEANDERQEPEAAEASVIAPPPRSLHIRAVEAAISTAITGEILDAGGDPKKYIRNVKKLIAAVEKVSETSVLGPSDFDISQGSFGVAPLYRPEDARSPMQEMVDILREAFDAQNQFQRQRLELDEARDRAMLGPMVPVVPTPALEAAPFTAPAEEFKPELEAVASTEEEDPCTR
jgi:hypothetical protein